MRPSRAVDHSKFDTPMGGQAGTSDDLPGRRLNPETLDRVTALETAKALARTAEGAT
jgi:hypothetical protein